MIFRLLLIAHAILLRTLPCLCECPSSLFGGRHQEIQLSSMVLWESRTEVSLAVTRAVSPACREPSHHLLLEKLPLRHTWKTWSNTETVFFSVASYFCPRRLLYLVSSSGVQWRSSVVFLSTGFSSNSSISLRWRTSMHDQDWVFLFQRILCPAKVTSL